MTSKQEQHEIDTTVEALRKRQQQVRKAIERGYFSSTPEGQQLTRDVLLGYSKAVEDHITRLVGRSGRFASAAAHLFFQLKDLEVSYDHVSFVALHPYQAKPTHTRLHCHWQGNPGGAEKSVLHPELGRGREKDPRQAAEETTSDTQIPKPWSEAVDGAPTA